MSRPLHLLLSITLITVTLWVEVGAVFLEKCERCSGASVVSASAAAAMVPIVDVFVVIAKLRKYEHVTGGPFWLTLDVLRRFAKTTSVVLPPSSRHNHSQATSFDTRIHILTESDDIIQHARTHLSHPYYVHDMRHYADLTASFYQTYSKTHVSVNSLDYEFLCFNRWHLFSNITETWNQQWYPQHPDFHINHILSLDLDVLMTISAADFVRRVAASLASSQDSLSDFEVAVIGLGAINIFTPKGLKSFSNYIQGWYGKSDEDIKQANAKYGRFFSDMMIMKEYLETTKSTEQRNACFEYWKASEYYSWKEETTNKCLLQRLGCVPMSGYREMMKNNNIRFYRGKEALTDAYSLASMVKDGFGEIYAKGDREDVPYCLIHFQGREFKIWLYFYSIIVDQLLFMASTPNVVHSNNTAATAVDKTPLLVTETTKPKKLFLLTGSTQGVAKSALSYEAYITTFKSTPIMYAVSPHLLDLLPLGTPIDQRLALPKAKRAWSTRQTQQQYDQQSMHY